jgi:hypothetical protein
MTEVTECISLNEQDWQDAFLGRVLYFKIKFYDRIQT